MSDESPVESQLTDTGVAHPPPARTRPIRPLVTIAAIAWCVVVFFGVTSEGGINSWKQLDIRIGNAAHVSGMVFGLAVADAFVTRRIAKLALATQAVLIVFAIVSLVWSPWSIGWLSHKAYEAHEAHRYNTALDYYSRILRRDDRNAWAHYNRGAAYAASGDWESAGHDFTKAHQIDPHYEVPK